MITCTCGHDIDGHYADVGCVSCDAPHGDFCPCEQPPSAIATIDRGKLITLLRDEWVDPVWNADAIIAALPELMGGGER